MPQAPNRMVVSEKFYRWLETVGKLEVFLELKKLQDAYIQEGTNTSSYGYRAVSTEKLREFLNRYDGRLANIREELRRRGE